MKKRLLLVLSLVAVFACLFAISTFAAEIGGVYYTLNGGENPTATVNNETNVQITILLFDINLTSLFSQSSQPVSVDSNQARFLAGARDLFQQN